MSIDRLLREYAESFRREWEEACKKIAWFEQRYREREMCCEPDYDYELGCYVHAEGCERPESNYKKEEGE